MKYQQSNKIIINTLAGSLFFEKGKPTTLYVVGVVFYVII